MSLDLRQGIWKVLAYFDLFRYPVTEQEIMTFLDRRISPAALSDALQEMLSEKRIYLYDGYFLARDDRTLVIRRKEGYQRAQPLLRRGRRICHLLYRLPYVRALGISGSLSKNFADEDADIDYFIITKTGRLWVARTIMHVFKKLSFLLGRQHWFCMNYYIDETALEIKEKNCFTAMEVITLYPVCGDAVLCDFFQRNAWASLYYPNCNPKTCCADFAGADSRLKKMMERLLDGRLGDHMDDYFMRLTARRWKRKEDLRKKSVKGNLMALQTEKHLSKPSPGLFQKQILARFAENLERLSGERPDTQLKASSSRR